MLLRFEVSNHRSILEPVELSMIAVDKDRPSARQFDLLHERVLTVAGIYRSERIREVKCPRGPRLAVHGRKAIASDMGGVHPP